MKYRGTSNNSKGPKSKGDPSAKLKSLLAKLTLNHLKSSVLNIIIHFISYQNVKLFPGIGNPYMVMENTLSGTAG